MSDEGFTTITMAEQLQKSTSKRHWLAGSRLLKRVSREDGVAFNPDTVLL